MKRKVFLLITLLSVILTGCSSGEGGGFDILKVLQNPVVMVIGGILIAYWMFKHSK